MRWLSIIGLTFTLVSTSAWSQDSDEFDWKITPYLWLVNMNGDLSIGPIDQDIDTSLREFVSELDAAVQIYGELGKGKHAVHLDYTYLRVKPDPTELPSPPFLPDSELATKLTNKIFEAAYNYRWNGPDGPALVLGARQIDMEIRMSPARLEAVNAGPNWWDYFVGIKTHNAIGPKWDFDFYGTVGTGGSDLPWTVQANFGRRYSNDNRLMLGFRAWGLDYSDADSSRRATLDLNMYGFVVGYEFN
jgi:hypothetical protein